MVGSPLTATTAAQMTDTSKIYVYTGNQSGYTNGNWYYYNGAKWVSGGVYNSIAIETDKTLLVKGSAADAAVVGEKITNLNDTVSTIKPIVTSETISTNIVTPISIRMYPESSGMAVINNDKSITITNVPRQTNIWIYWQENDPITLKAGDYTLCVDEGLFVYGIHSLLVQYHENGTYQNTLATCTGAETHFTVENDITAKFRFAFFTGTGNVVNWNGHIWINKGDAQEYLPVGASVLTPKEFVDTNQGKENSGKILLVDTNGMVSLADNSLEAVVSEELYKKGNLLNYDTITSGYIKADGTVQPYNTLWCSDFCEVEPGILYSYNVYPTQYFAFYNADKTILESYSTIGAMRKISSGSTVYQVDIPDGAKYFRGTFGYNQKELKTAWISNIPEMPSIIDTYSIKDVYPYTFSPNNPCDYTELTVRAFSKVVCIGDSLTYGGFNLSNSGSSTGETQSSQELSTRYSYPSNFQRITGIETVNVGDSGETSVSWYQKHSQDDFSSFDLAIIFLGVNDSAFHVSDVETITAMQNIVTMLKNARFGMKIAICSCIPAYDGAGYQAKGQLILNWAKGLDDPDIIPLDLAQYSYVKPRTSYTAGHCSALGYYQMALDIARYISWYIDQHKRDFRFIHFIGSPDAEWSYD